MAMSSLPAVLSTLREARAQRRYLRAPQPLFFPTSEEVPESRWHLELRTALFLMLQEAFGHVAIIGSDQFMYWEPANPRACVAPDVMVRLGETDAQFESWKVWERGAPQLAIELVSKGDPMGLAWTEKLERYRHVGIVELVRFDRDDERAPLRLWDNVDGDLVERDPEAPGFTRCDVLDGYWIAARDARRGPWLRLSRDALGGDLFLTPSERAENERARADRADARVAELEAELARLKNGR